MNNCPEVFAIKVLLLNRLSAAKSVAGDSIQFTKTAEYLVKLGVKVDTKYSVGQRLDEYDLIHLFNIIPVEETYQNYQKARQLGKKMVLSTVFWDPTEYLQQTNFETSFGDWWRQTMPLRQEILSGVNLILPNSLMELEILKKSFQTLPPAVIVPNAADSYFSNALPHRFINKYGINDFLLTVGRISARKNQLLLIKAAKELNIPLVIIGPINDGIYYQQCRQAAMGHKVSFIDTLPQEQLASAYAAARVHALISWYDTPGLVSLEAALAGCNIVTTDRGCAREYFEDLVYYCNPNDYHSILNAIEKAWNSPVNPNLKAKVLQEFTWEKTATKTLEAYKTICNLN